MAAEHLTVRLKINRGRAQSITQEARARIKRARKGDRPAMVRQYAQRIVSECIRVDMRGLPRFDGAGGGVVSAAACKIGVNSPEYIVVPRSLAKRGASSGGGV